MKIGDIFNSLINEVINNKKFEELPKNIKNKLSEFISQGFSSEIVMQYYNDFISMKDMKEFLTCTANNITMPVGDKRKDILQYKHFEQLETIINEVSRLKNVGSQNYEEIIVDGKPIFHNNDVEIYYADTPRACIQYKGKYNYSWCIARNDSGNMFYTYRLKPHEPAFYFVKRILATKMEFDNWNGEFKDKYHFFVIQIINNPNYYNDNDTNNYTVTSANNDGDKQMSWNDILKIAPELNGLKNKFKPKPLSPKEREKIELYKNGLSDDDFAKLPYKEKEYYMDVYVTGGQRVLTDEQFRVLPDELKNKYIGFGIGLTDNQYEIIKGNKKLVDRYLDIIDKKVDKYIENKGGDGIKFTDNELKFFENLNLLKLCKMIYFMKSYQIDIILENSSEVDYLIDIILDVKGDSIIYFDISKMLELSNDPEGIASKILQNNILSVDNFIAIYNRFEDMSLFINSYGKKNMFKFFNQLGRQDFYKIVQKLINIKYLLKLIPSSILNKLINTANFNTLFTLFTDDSIYNVDYLIKEIDTNNLIRFFDYLYRDYYNIINGRLIILPKIRNYKYFLEKIKDAKYYQDCKLDIEKMVSKKFEK